MKFELSAPPTMMGTCHCTRCRKAGSGVFVFVRREAFRWICGEDAVVRHEPEPPFQHRRAFCGRCGASLGEPDLTQESFPISATSLDDDPQLRNRFHEFVAEKPDWWAIGDAAKQFPGHPVRSTPA